MWLRVSGHSVEELIAVRCDNPTEHKHSLWVLCRYLNSKPGLRTTGYYR